MAQEIYQIWVQGHLDVERSSWFDGLAISHNSNGETRLFHQFGESASLFASLKSFILSYWLP